MQGVDVTLSVLIDNAVYEYEKKTGEIIREYNLSPEMAEMAMEKALLKMKSNKITLYATAMHEMFVEKPEKEV